MSAELAIRPGKLSLTHNGMHSVNWNFSDSNFEFIFGRDKVCRVHSFLAEFLSPKVARLRRCDISFDAYTFSDSSMFDVFESIHSSLRSSGVVQVETSNFAALFRLSQELENDDLFFSLLGRIDAGSMGLPEVIRLLRAGTDFGTAFPDGFYSLRDHVASRFYTIKKEILDDLDLETAQLLLSSPSLQLKDEDSLYDFVRARSENDWRFTSLFEFIRFEYLSEKSIKDFVSFTSEDFIGNINSSVWGQICRRLVLATKCIDPRKFMWRPGLLMFHAESDNLDGIIAYLTRECRGNVHEYGIVNVTASSYENSWRPENAVDLNTDSIFASRSEENSWICYEFKDCGVIPTSYTVRSYDEEGEMYHLASWVIEVSNDGAVWTEIDRRTDDDSLNDAHAIANFTIARVPSKSYRFFRLRVTGQNHYYYWPDYAIWICALEIFGTMDTTSTGTATNDELCAVRA